MREPKFIGAFRELYRDHEPARLFPSIREATADIPQEHEREIVAYLRGGVCVGARGGFYEDVLDASNPTGLLRHTYTDGTFIWTLDIAHYVEKYHLRLPEEFVRHMASRGWCPPTLEDVDAERANE